MNERRQGERRTHPNAVVVAVPRHELKDIMKRALNTLEPQNAPEWTYQVADALERDDGPYIQLMCGWENTPTDSQRVLPVGKRYPEYLQRIAEAHERMTKEEFAAFIAGSWENE